MGHVWTREDWNDIIRRVNDLIQNPDPGCDDLEPLEEVSEKHIWTPDDITTVRDKLLEICPENVFEAETVKWKQEIIDEIETAIENGWCGCCEWDGIYTIIPEGPVVLSSSADVDIVRPPCTITQHQQTNTYYFPIEGLSVGPPNIAYRFWGFRAPLQVLYSKGYGTGGESEHLWEWSILGIGYVTTDGLITFDNCEAYPAGDLAYKPPPSRELTLATQKTSWRDENRGGCTWYTGSPPVIYDYNHVYETYILVSITPTLQIGSAAELIAAGFTSSAILNNNRWRQPTCI
jgi:hypothetical protein